MAKFNLPPLPITSQEPINVPSNSFLFGSLPQQQMPIQQPQTFLPTNFMDLYSGAVEGKNFGDPDIARAIQQYGGRNVAEQMMTQNKNFGSQNAANLIAQEQQQFNPMLQMQAPVISPITENFVKPREQMPYQPTYNQPQTFLPQENIIPNSKIEGDISKQPSFLDKLGGVLKNPAVLTGLGTAAAVGLTGGDITQALTYGLKSGTGVADKQLEDRQNRQILKTIYGLTDEQLPQGLITNDIMKQYESSTSAKAKADYNQAILGTRGMSLKSAIDTYKAQGLISDSDFARLSSLPEYANETTVPTSYINKVLEPYLIAKRGEQALTLEDTKFGNKKEMAALQDKYKLGQIAASGGQSRQTALFKEELPSTQVGIQKDLSAIGKTEAEQATAGLGLDSITNQLANFEGMFKVMPSKTGAYTTGALREATGTLTPQEAKFDAEKTLLFNKIARDLGGEKGVLSDQDIKRVAASLPTRYDSLAQKQAKMSAIHNLLDIRVKEYQKKISTYRQYTQPTQGQPQGQMQIGRYKVRVK